MMSQWITVAHIVLAALLGGAIGFERELKHKPAGLRTHMLVGTAAALLISLADIVLVHFEPYGSALIRSDPLRIVEAVIVGTSFIGAGVILSSNDKVQHLTTAASILLVAGVGMSIALGSYFIGICVTLLGLFINWPVGAIGYKMHERRR